ncbi:NADPH-dependent FMN reductase [Pelagibacterium halotolerans]|nr:NAD(P)H-dependent oxidoreductase [Pelagibacterium halotolerans]QJR17646.1 hypothetical protein HKM20_03840 [Pelagibacterium halotolerans]SEA83805.1 NAD(P)H-dependent FMN reductase [Pelagibacterium halotolerans]
MSKKTVLFVSGSSQVGSSIWRMVGAAAALAEREMSDTITAVTLNLADYEIPAFTEDTAASVPDSVAAVRAIVAGADAIFMSSDEYTGAFSSVFRNAAGWLGQDVDGAGNLFQSKLITLCGAPTGGVGALRGHPALHQFLLELGANVYSQKFELGSTAKLLGPDGNLSPTVERQLREGAFAKLTEMPA